MISYWKVRSKVYYNDENFSFPSSPNGRIDNHIVCQIILWKIWFEVHQLHPVFCFLWWKCRIYGLWIVKFGFHIILLLQLLVMAFHFAWRFGWSFLFPLAMLNFICGNKPFFPSSKNGVPVLVGLVMSGMVDFAKSQPQFYGWCLFAFFFFCQNPMSFWLLNVITFVWFKLPL